MFDFRQSSDYMSLDMPDGKASDGTLPNRNTYWVKRGMLLAGEYPGHARSAKARERLREYLKAGVTFFLDLTVRGELRSYDRFLAEEAEAMGINALYLRMPIQDASVPRSHEYMVEILDVLDNALKNGHLTYVHCWGGVGRTGLVVGCYLVRHGMKPEQALQELSRLWRGVEKSNYHPCSPETAQQADFIRRWSETPKPRLKPASK